MPFGSLTWEMLGTLVLVATALIAVPVGLVIALVLTDRSFRR